MRSLYIARPIDFAGGHRSTHDIAYAVQVLKTQALPDSKVATYDPAAAWTIGTGREVGPEVQDVNNKAIYSADSMLVFAPRAVKSWGVPAEAETAHRRGMNVAIVTDGPVSWAMPQGNNVRVFQVEPLQSQSGGWLEPAVAALSWLSDAPAPRFTTRGQDRDRTTLAFATADGADPRQVQLPTRAYSDDAGLDLYTNQGLWVGVGEFVDVSVGLKVQLPPWSWGFLVGRSSTLRKRKLLVNPGIIDAGYRGELFVGVQNMGPKPVRIEPGERLAQFIIMGNATRKVNPVMVDALDEHPRGVNGFGSSGV